MAMARSVAGAVAVGAATDRLRAARQRLALAGAAVTVDTTSSTAATAGSVSA